MVRVWDLESRRYFSIRGPGYVRIGELKRPVLFFESGLSGAKNGRRHIKERGGWTFRFKTGCGVSKPFAACVYTGMAPKRLLVVFDFDWYFPKLQSWINSYSSCLQGRWPTRIPIDISLRSMPLIYAGRWRTSRLRCSGPILCSLSFRNSSGCSLTLCCSAQTLRAFHERGGKRDQIESALRNMPFVR